MKKFRWKFEIVRDAIDEDGTPNLWCTLDPKGHKWAIWAADEGFKIEIESDYIYDDGSKCVKQLKTLAGSKNWIKQNWFLYYN